MNLDENNQRILGDILGIRGSRQRAIIYQKYFRRQFTSSEGMMCLRECEDVRSSRRHEQIGGDPKQVRIVVDDISYIFTINEVDGELINVDGKQYPLRKIFFFSLFSDSVATSCVWLTIDPKNKTGYINGIDKRYRCIGFSSGRGFPVEPLVGENQGAILMKALIKFCRFNAERFGINRLELDDIAERECVDKDGVLLISESNMLLGREPYYMKFGFRPMERSALLKIEHNMRKMKGVKIEGLRQIEYLESESSKSMETDLKSFLMVNEGESAIESLILLRDQACGLYAEWYVYFYKYYGLKELVGRESRYELVL